MSTKIPWWTCIFCKKPNRPLKRKLISTTGQLCHGFSGVQKIVPSFDFTDQMRHARWLGCASEDVSHLDRSKSLHFHGKQPSKSLILTRENHPLLAYGKSNPRLKVVNNKSYAKQAQSTGLSRASHIATTYSQCKLCDLYFINHHAGPYWRHNSR